MKQILLFLFVLVKISSAHAQAIRVVGECMITFSIDIENGNDNATKTLYIKGKKTRSEVESPSFNQTTIYDSKTGTAVILKDIGGEKYLKRLNAAEWKDKNKEWDGLSIKFTNETKNILGYPCKKAVATTKTGKSFSLYYTTTIASSATENPYQFKNIPGLVLEYESQTSEGKKIAFKATKINFSPVPASKFEIPTEGYREL